MRLIVILLSLLFAANAITNENAFETIRNDIELQNKHQDRGKLSSDNTCTMNGSENCPLSAMTEDVSYLVQPGGDTRCIFSTSSPYGFQVIKGDSDKLLVYFQGGGACWDRASTVAGMCTTDADPQRNLVGVFDRNSEQNRFKDYTIVQALYCSGDVFGGNVTRPYNDKAGQPVIQSGIQNAQATLDWIVAQQANGGLASTLNDVVVMGCSAGSIGAQIWGPIILKTLPWKQAAIIPDSYAGVFPPNSQGPLMKSFGFCTGPFLTPYPNMLQTCNEGDFSLQDLMKEYMKDSPSIPFSYIQSKTDDVQMSFYVAIGLTTNASAEITPTEFYNDLNVIFATYSKDGPNFVTYLVDGYQHCFTNYDIYYTADGFGKDDNGKKSTGMNYHLNIFILLFKYIYIY